MHTTQVGLAVGMLVGLVPPLSRLFFDRGAALAPLGLVSYL